MIKNYLKVAWRNLMKSKVFSFINVLGLSVGLTCCMLITLYLWHETSYDSYHKNIKRLYQVGSVFIAEGQEQRFSSCPAGLAGTMKEVFPQIEATARICHLLAEDKTLMQYRNSAGNVTSFYEDKGFLADSGFFNLFTYNFVEGNPVSAMNGPYSIVLSEEIAGKIFGAQAALGKVVHISSNSNGDHDYIVTGVYRPSKLPSHIDGRFFLSMYGGKYGEFIHTTNLANNNQFFTYLLLKPGVDPKQLERQFPAFVDKYEGKDLKEAGFYKKQFLVPVRDIHLHSTMENELDVTPGGSTTYLYILASIALFTLLIACINFMNLATARSTKRSAEVGVRKALGAGRSSLIRQFLGEALLMAVIAYAFALCFTYALFPGFESVAHKDIQLSTGQIVSLGTAFLFLAVITGLVAGSYPAFYLSSFKPVRILKGKLTNSLAVASLRKGLVVFQFVISVILIVASVVIARQMNFLRNADLGFSKDQQLVLPLRGSVSRKMFSSMKDALDKNPRVLSVGASAYYPGIQNSTDQLFYAEGKTARDGTDFNFLNTLGIQRLTGHLFSPQFPADSVDGIILNEKAVRLIGYTPENAIGKKVYNEFQGNVQTLRIVGVVKDFHFEDLHVPITAFAFQIYSTFDHFNYMVVHLKAGDIGAAIASVEQTWHQLDPYEPFEYNFLDQQFQKNYEADTRLSALVGYFTAIAICISCLGLFGLAAFSAEQRTKEIGIRKVLGASEGSIVALLSGDFLKLVGISVLLASPIAWLIMQRWLQDFAYRTTISWTVFAYTTTAAMLIALITISFQAIRAATSSPVKCLRSE